jgi:hypothetical protein
MSRSAKSIWAWAIAARTVAQVVASVSSCSARELARAPDAVLRRDGGGHLVQGAVGEHRGDLLRGREGRGRGSA